MRLAVFALLILAALPARAQDDAMKPFVGLFKGVATVKAVGQGGKVVETKRLIFFELKPSPKGFRLHWASMEARDATASFEDARRREESAEFERQDKNVYTAFIKNDKSGESGFYMARFVGNHFIMQVTGVDEQGRLINQIYRRSIAGGKMTMTYQLMVNTVLTRTIQGQLEREGS